MPVSPRAPGFERKLKEGSYGIIMEFDSYTRRAVVVLANPGTNRPGRVVKDVPVPIVLGVQSVDPQMGQTCWVEFKDGEENFPVIVSFFNRDYSEQDWEGHNKAVTPIPKYMLT